MASCSVIIGSGPEGVTTVAVGGDLDLVGGPELGEVLRTLAAAGDPTKVVVDLEAVTFLDSSGISALVVAHQDLAGLGVRMVVAGGRDNVRKVLALTGVEELLGDEMAAEAACA
jgi:anti-anti-sigma factor